MVIEDLNIWIIWLLVKLEDHYKPLWNCEIKRKNEEKSKQVIWMKLH